MSSASTTTPPEVLSSDIDTADACESEIRIRMGDQVKYLLIEPGIYGCDILSFPPDLFNHLPPLSPGDWTKAHISRRPEGIHVEFTNAKLKGVMAPWHHNMIDVLSLHRVESHAARVAEVRYGSGTAIAKIARFEYEVPRMENETRMYQMLDKHDIGPAFLGHLTENGRVMGFLIEKLEGRVAHIDDIAACELVVNKLHALGIVHGDLNRHNFLVTSSLTKLIDFENGDMRGNPRDMEKEFSMLAEQLKEDTGRGGKGIPDDD